MHCLLWCTSFDSMDREAWATVPRIPTEELAPSLGKHELAGMQASESAAPGLRTCCSRALEHRLNGCAICT